MSFLLSACTTEKPDNEIKEVYDMSQIGRDSSYEPKENTLSAFIVLLNPNAPLNVYSPITLSLPNPMFP